ncbi:hypothetical protein FYJ26_01325 [Anaerococcus sp. WCA-380-WT-2B]|uniref:Peptidase C39-like domain-containing protein n=1 Tax=Anaerococcus porci TaxID=2652269 RepID=A0A6N7VSN5_9FIRM|nr:C39 family peptidase [Anaerococcus porci]MSS77083.1 hypothetical protein [Anaerococcus porci]
MTKILVLILLSLSLTGCGKDKKSIDDKDLPTTLKDIEYITKKYINYDTNAKSDILNITYQDEEYKPKIKSSDYTELKNYLKENMKNDLKLNWIYENFDKIDEIEQRLVGNDTDTGEFIYNRHNNKTDFKMKDGESIKLNRKTPFFLQWDNRWAYNNLSDTCIAIAGCGPTSMSMAIRRFIDDDSINPKTIANDANEFMTENGIAWEFFFHEANKYKLSINEIANNKDDLIKALDKGPLIVSVTPGYFTTSGHILVIDSYDGDKFLINDPNSIKNTNITWSFDDISGQILKIWAISK